MNGDQQDDVLARLRQTEDRLSRAQRSARAGFWDWHIPSGRIDWSPELFQLFGLDPTTCEASFESWRQLVHPSDVAAAEERISAAIASHTSLDSNYRIIRPDGEVRWINAVGDTTYDPHDQPVSFAGFCLDITDRRRAEVAYHDLQERTEFALSSSRVGAWDLDLVDHSAVRTIEHDRIFGYTDLQPEWTYEMFLAHVHPDDRARVDAAFQEAIATKGTWNFECRILARDGQVRTIAASGRHRLDPRTAHLRMSGIVEDVTTWVEAESVLLDQRWRLESIIEGTGVGTWEWNVETGETKFSERGAEMLGYTLRELEPTRIETWTSLSHPDDLRVAMAILERHFAGETPRYDAEIRMRHKNGHWVVMHDRGKVFRWTPEGKPLLMFGTHTDITERKRVEEALRTSEKRFRDIMFSIADWVWEVDAEGVYTYSSSRGFAMFQDVLGKKPFDFMPPEEAERVGPIFADFLARKMPIRDLENWNVRHDGERICLLTNAVPMLDAEGNLLGYRGVDRDITARKHAEAERKTLEAQLQQAQKMESVGRLAGGVAHDFNNMLSVILGHVEMALDKAGDSAPLRKDLQAIQNAAARSANLTRQLLAFARKQTVLPVVLDLNDTVGGMLAMLRRLIGEHIRLVWSPGAELPPVKMDPGQIDQLLANLCVNARDAIGGSGTVSIDTRTVTLDDTFCAPHDGALPGAFIRLSVSDTGCGMSDDVQAHLFEPFFTTKPLGEGTGLGLATVYGIVQQNHGIITVTSAVDRGTTFEIFLPAHLAGAATAEPVAKSAPGARGNETVLYVEDERDILALVTTLLEASGYRVIAAGTPVEALRLAREHQGGIDLLLTDVVMPEMNGRELEREIVALYPGIRRLFISGYTADVIAHHGVLADGVNFLQKPCSRRDLVTKVREVLDQAPPSAEPEA